MSYRTDETAIPASPLYSGSDSDSTHSMTSSPEQPLKDFHFLNNSWPFLDKTDNQLSFDSALTLNDRSLYSSNKFSTVEIGDAALDSTNSRNISNHRVCNDIPDLDSCYDVQSSQANSRNSSPRLSSRQGLDCSWNSSGSSPDAMALYSYRGKHYNPSGSGERTSQEIKDCTDWANGFVSFGDNHPIIDLITSLADGQTLLTLVEQLLCVSIPPVHIKPALHVQKAENIQLCLDVLKASGVAIRDDVTPEDVVQGNAKIVLALCQCLQKHFESKPTQHRLLENDRGRFTRSDQSHCRSTSPPLINQGGFTSSSAKSNRSPNNHLFTSSNSPTNRPRENYNDSLMRNQHHSSVSPINQPLINDQGQYTSRIGQWPSSLLNLRTATPQDDDRGRYMDNQERSSVSPIGQPQDSDRGRYMDNQVRTSVSPVGGPQDNGHGRCMYGLSKSPRLPVVDADDIALLNWVATMTKKTVNSYQSLQDGHVLCLLVNKLTDGAVPDIVLEYGLPSEKISLALTFCQEELGLSTVLTPESILHLTDKNILYFFLKDLHRVFIERKQQERKQTDVGMEKTQKSTEQIKGPNAKCPDKQHFFNSYNDSVKLSKTDLQHLGEDKSGKQGSESLESRSQFLSAKFLREGNKENIDEKIQDSLQIGLHKATRNNDNLSSFSKLLLDNSFGQEDEYSDNEGHCFIEKRKNTENKTRILPGHERKFYDDDITNLLPRETIFDPVNWQLPYKPHASKSWQKERENARDKIDHLSEQLKLLKEEYFKYMNIEIQKDELLGKTNKEDIDLNYISGSPKSREALPDQNRQSHHKLSPNKSNSKRFSESFNSYFSKDKATTPPYRTWSVYINTEGDRYKGASKKKKLEGEKESSVKHLTERPTTGFPSEAGHVTSEVINSRCDSEKKKGDFPGIVHLEKSPQIKQIQQVKSRGLNEKRSSDAGLSVCSTDSYDSSGHLHGLTALVRLSSKRANATDSEN